MGAWSHEPFGNDTACDWAYGLENAKDLKYIEETLDRIIDAEEDYVDASDAEEAVAAAEVVAKLLGCGTQSDAYTKTADDWVSSIGAQLQSRLEEQSETGATEDPDGRLRAERALGRN